MRINNVINECFTEYKIEIWNEKKECWEHFKSCLTYYEMIKMREIYLKQIDNCIIRCIKVIDIKEI